jgi:chromosome segregation ATPase
MHLTKHTILMKRMFILACLMSCIFAVSCYDDEIEDLQEKIEALEGTQIASLQEQVAAIKNTLPELEKTDKELSAYIKSLQSTASDLEKSINETNDKIEEVKSALKDEISTEKATIMAQLTALKSDLEAELAKINATIAALQAKDDELDKKIAELRAYVDTELASNKDWINATFATLEQYSSLAAEIATIKSNITALNTSIESLESRMVETIANEITKALEPIKDELVASIISDVANSYLEAIADAKNEITAAYTAAIEVAVTKLETSMKSWVSDQLKGYCTIAEAEGKLAALLSTVSENDKAIQTEIEGLEQELSKTKKEIFEAYSKAIEDAIIESEGVINGKIAIAIAEANVKVEKEIEEINSKIAAIESRLEKIEGDIATIGEQIAGINATIGNLKETDAELEEYIKSLQATAAGLQAAINETSSKIDEIESALQGEVSQAKTELVAQLNAMRSEMEAELEQINATIAALMAKDAELDRKITDLKAYVDSELANNEDWVNATFATLEQYSALATEVATIKAQIVAVNTSIAELENRLSEKWENDLANATATLGATIQEKVAEITASYTSAISDAKEEITAAYTAAIAESISSLEASMISWVSNKFKGYYTIAEVEGKLAALMNIVSDNDNTTKAEIEELAKSIANTKKEIAEDYKNAIEEVINENNGAIDGKIAQAIAQINSNVENKIAEINAKIAAIESRLDKIERDIATIGEQITAINATIENLKETDDELEGYIKSLQSTAADLQVAINETDSKINEIERVLQGEVSQAKAELLAQLNAMRTEMVAELQQLNATVAALQAKDNELDGKIEALKSYVDTELANNANWANATFATLEQYSALASEIATIKAQITAVNTSIAELETRLNEKWENDLANATANLDITIQNKVAEITMAYTQAIVSAKEEITIAYTEAIAAAVSSLESSMKLWVSEQLEGYYTIAEIEGKLAALMNIISENDKAAKAEVEELTKSIANTKKEIAEDYKNAIEEAINENNGAIDGKIAQAIAQINSNAKNEIAEINTKIAAIESRLSKIEEDIEDLQQEIANLLKRIQSVTYIPKYSDGKATMTKNIGVDEGIAEFDFQISPKDAVTDIAANWQSILSMKAVYTLTRAVSFIDLPVLSCEADAANGIISITVSGKNLSEEFFNGNQEASVALYISDGNNSVTSNYINMLGWFSDNIYIRDANFKAYLVKNFDSNKDGHISHSEATSVIELDCSNLNISDIAGIEYFTNIEYLDCSNNYICDLNLSNNKKLITLYCANNALSLIDVRALSALQSIDFSSNRQLVKEIDLSANSTLKYVYAINCPSVERIIVNESCTSNNIAITYDVETAIVTNKSGNVISKYFVGQFLPSESAGAIVYKITDSSIGLISARESYEEQYANELKLLYSNWSVPSLGEYTDFVLNNISVINNVLKHYEYPEIQMSRGYWTSTSIYSSGYYTTVSFSYDTSTKKYSYSRYNESGRDSSHFVRLFKSKNK